MHELKKMTLLGVVMLCLVGIASASEVDAKYNAAMAKMDKGNRTQALLEFRDLATGYPNHQLNGNFHYWAGEALLGLGKTEEAIVEYCLAASCKNSNKLKDARYRIGFCYAKLGLKDKAKAEWERFIRDFPNEALTTKVKQKMSSE